MKLGENSPETACALCRRPASKLTQHHLVPRSRTRKAKKRRSAGASTHVTDADATIALCRDCHSMVHAVLTERELARDYSTVEALRAHAEIASFLRFIAKQDPERRVAVRWTRRRREVS